MKIRKANVRRSRSGPKFFIRRDTRAMPCAHAGTRVRTSSRTRLSVYPAGNRRLEGAFSQAFFGAKSAPARTEISDFRAVLEWKSVPLRLAAENNASARSSRVGVSKNFKNSQTLLTPERGGVSTALVDPTAEEPVAASVTITVTTILRILGRFRNAKSAYRFVSPTHTAFTRAARLVECRGSPL